MEEYTSMLIGLVGTSSLFFYLNVHFKNETFKKVFFILGLLMLNTTILTASLIAENEGITYFSTLLPTLFIGMLLITAYFFYLYIIKTIFESIELFMKKRRADYED